MSSRTYQTLHKILFQHFFGRNINIRVTAFFVIVVAVITGASTVLASTTSVDSIDSIEFTADSNIDSQVFNQELVQAQEVSQELDQKIVQEPKALLDNQPASIPNPSRDQIDLFGMHVLNVHELKLATSVLHELYGTLPQRAAELKESESESELAGSDGGVLKNEEITSQSNWRYLTIPFTLEDLDKRSEWQAFFSEARSARIIPLVRLTTQFADGSWQQPTRKNVVDQISFLNELEWPTQQKHIIIFNEVNHAPEWGGEINPEMYAEYLAFAANWAKTEGSDFVIMPAAMDLAAPNGATTMEAFTYLDRMLQSDPAVFDAIDIWNSHSYPNPAFSSSPQRTGQNSLRGFLHELSFISQRTGKELPVIITETGWDLGNARQPRLTEYYAYTFANIWSDPRVLGVTPFILKGDPGPFSGFSFVNASDTPTAQFNAVQRALQSL